MRKNYNTNSIEVMIRLNSTSLPIDDLYFQKYVENETDELETSLTKGSVDSWTEIIYYKKEENLNSQIRE